MRSNDYQGVKKKGRKKKREEEGKMSGLFALQKGERKGGGGKDGESPTRLSRGKEKKREEDGSRVFTCAPEKGEEREEETKVL